MKKIRTIALVFGAFVLLGSCIDIDMRLEVSDNGSADLVARYTIDRDVWERGVFDDDDPNRIFPVSRRDMEELALRLEGVNLDRYRLAGDDQMVTIEATFSISDPQSLALLWAGATARTAEFRFTPREGNVRLPIAAARGPVDTAAADLVRDRLRESRFRLELIAPRPIESVIAPADLRYVTRPNERSIVVETELADIVLEADGYVVEVVWEAENARP